MIPMVRTLTQSDKAILAIVLLDAGVKARIRKIRIGFRVCFEGEQTAVLVALNNNGFRDGCGSHFSHLSFNQPHEIFVRYRRP